MITTLSGENSFGWRRALGSLVGDFIDGYGDLSLERLDGDEDSFESIRRALSVIPFLAPKQLVVLRSPSKNKQFLEEFEDLFKNLPDSTDVIIVEPKIDKRLTYYKYLKKYTNYTVFSELDNGSLINWICSHVKQREGSISRAEATYLVERVGTSQQLLANELDKLMLYNPGITRQAIDLLTELNPQSTIFQLLEEAFSGNTKSIIDLYAQQRSIKVEPQQIIAMLGWQLHVLALLKTAGDRSTDQIAKEASMSPYVIRKSQTIASRLSLGELKKLISNLTTIDKRLKSTKIDGDEALQHYLLSLNN